MDGITSPATTRQRIIVTGNSGSGKTTLAQRIAASMACPHIDLDTIYWQDQIGLKKRVEPAAKQMVAELAATQHWVIEGVYGWLAEVALPRATALIWLNLPWPECKAGLEARGPAYSPSPAEYDALLTWAGQYWTRQSPSSEAGHRRLYDAFTGEKFELRSRDEVASFLADQDFS
jgi:energy-coupling factor transporter ATP-binding protein EcfA2